MRRSVLLAAVVGLQFLACRAAFCQFSYPDFSSVQGLELTGTAVQYGNRLRIAPSRQDTTGYATYSSVQAVSAGFATAFDFQYTNFSGGWYGKQGTDGIAFLVVPSSGSERLLVAFRGIWAPQVGVMSNNRVEVWMNGAVVQRTDVEPLGISFSDGNVKSAAIGYDGDRVSVILNGQQVMDCGVSLSSFGLSKVGFEGYMGAAMADQDILDWSFTPVPEPAGLSVLAAGVGCVIGAGRHRRTKANR